MPDAKTLPFEYLAGPAGVLRITTSDGVVHEVGVGLTVFSVFDSGLVNADGTPQFEIRVGVQFDRHVGSR